ncbi:hypothetical protein QFC22_004162 [Naganishia vaughanmartiniae]|uniref:Uncharacterized protein n=1 Tax=Naganishia vaughanmartiniae TaxID=1424756 RepID=A0ACC2X2Y0_9TREE|nr:hypothetical protein QFC22_004162 [Naganishia vaughanmartiniae]
MAIKNSLKRMQLPQALESLKNGTGATTTLPPSVRAVTVNYVYRRAGKGVEDFISKVAPRLAYANPAISFDIKHQPNPKTKAKDPALQKRAEESAKQIEATGMAPTLTVDFHETSPQSIRLQQMDPNRILTELVALAEGRSTIASTAALSQ